MKKTRITAIITCIALVISSIGLCVSAEGTGFSDGDVICYENFNGKVTSEIKYAKTWFTGDKNNMSYSVDSDVLTVKSTGSNIDYLEVVPAGMLGDQTAYTISMDIMPTSIPSASYGAGIAIHSGFPADTTKTNDYDSYLFRNYNNDGELTFSRYLRQNGASKSAKDFMTKGTAGGLNTWYNIKLVVDGSKVDAYFNRSKTAVSFTDSYDYKSPICLVSVGASEFKVDNIVIWAGSSVLPDKTLSDGEVIYQEKYDGKTASELNYSRAWSSTSVNNLGYSVEDNVLSIASTGGNIDYLQIVSAEIMGNQKKYTVSVDIMPLSLGSSAGLGLALHSAFPVDPTQTNDYDSYVFRDYSADGKLTFSRYLRDDGKSVGAKDITAKGAAGGYNEWYNVKIEVNGSNVKVYFNGSSTPAAFTDSYDNRSPICLVSVGASEFKVDNVLIWAGVGVGPDLGYSDGDVIYKENFNGKTTADISYSRGWHTHATTNYASYTVENDALHVSAANNGYINYIEVVPADIMGRQIKYTVSMDINPLSLGGASYGLGIAIHSAFPTDMTQTNDYDSYIFRDYNADGNLTFSRYLRDDGKNVSGKDLTVKGAAGGYNEWYNVKLEVNGSKVDVYFNGSSTPVTITDSYNNKSPICLVSVGASEFLVDNIKVTAGLGLANAALDSASISIGQDFKLKAYVDANSSDSIAVRFTRNGKTEVAENYTETEGQLAFEYPEAINPQCLNDSICIELIDPESRTGVVFDKIDNYSVNAYLRALAADDNYPEYKDIAEKTIKYGIAAQLYTGYNTNDLVYEISDLTDGFDSVNNSVRDLSGNAGKLIKGAGMLLSDYNYIFFRYQASDSATVSLLKNGESVDISGKIKDNGDGTCTLTSDALYANEIETLYTLTVTDGDNECTVIYNGAAYINSKIEAGSVYGGITLGDFVKVLYNYSLSAMALTA